MTFYEFCDKIDETFHYHGSLLTLIFIFATAIVFLGLGYLATHPFLGIDSASVNIETEK